MKQVELKTMSLENFKCFQNKEIKFERDTKISGRNQEGKTTIMDAYFDVLTGKLSDGTMPDGVRRKEDGKEVDKVEVIRQIGVSINDKEYDLKKITKQKWKRPRGTKEEVFTGNETTYEIDEVPKKKKEFDEFISDNFDPEMLLICSNPTVFLNALRKNTTNARKILEKMSGFDLRQFIEENPQYENVYKMIENHTADEILKKLRKELNMNEKKIDEQNTKISYERNREVDSGNKSEIEKKLNEARSQLNKVEEQEETLANSFAAYETTSDELTKLKRQKDEIYNKSNETLRNERFELRADREKLEVKLQYERDVLKQNEWKLSDTEKQTKMYEDHLNNARDMYKKTVKEEYHDNKSAEIEKEVFDDNTTICPTCGQKLPEDQIDQLKAKFDENKKSRLLEEKEKERMWKYEKAERLQRITDAGNMYKQKANSFKEDKKLLEGLIEESKKTIANYEEKIKSINTELDNMPEEVDMSSNEEYVKVLKSIENLESKIGLLDSGKEKRRQLSEEKQKYFSEIAKLEAELHHLENAKKDKEGRIDSLEEDLKAFSQIGADLERQIDELLEFSLRKNECIAERINPYFKHLNFRFLDYTIEGNPVETCKIMCHGINYMDGLNHGDKILCEADLVSGFQKMNDVRLPIFIDDAESLDSDRIPEFEQQLILLIRSDNDLEVSKL